MLAGLTKPFHPRLLCDNLQRYGINQHRVLFRVKIEVNQYMFALRKVGNDCADLIFYATGISILMVLRSEVTIWSRSSFFVLRLSSFISA